jgi:hypothetical protein
VASRGPSHTLHLCPSAVRLDFNFPTAFRELASPDLGGHAAWRRGAMRFCRQQFQLHFCPKNWDPPDSPRKHCVPNKTPLHCRRFTNHNERALVCVYVCAGVSMKNGRSRKQQQQLRRPRPVARPRASSSRTATPSIPDHKLIRCIGRGSYGEVWLARSIVSTYRAVKIVRRGSFSDERPFEREFEGLKRFEPISRTHPGFVSILHIGRK